MDSQENDNLACQLIDQIARQNEIIAYLFGKNEQLRSRLYDIERPAKGDYSAGRLGKTTLPGEKTQQLTSNSDE